VYRRSICIDLCSADRGYFLIAETTFNEATDGLVAQIVKVQVVYANRVLNCQVPSGHKPI
jgi:hypothetical protein